MTVQRSKPLERMGTEAMTNHMMPYLIGMVETIRTIDPAIFEALRYDLADEMCGNRDKTDSDVVLYAKLSILEREVSSDRGMDCAFAGRKEGYPLWMLLDAWNATGRPPLPALAAIEKNATDPRTLERLRPLDERAREMILRHAATPEPTAVTRVPGR